MNLKRTFLSLLFLSATAHAATRLPTGVYLDPAAPTHEVGAMALGAALAPGGDRLALLTCGWRENGVEIVDVATGKVVQKLQQPAAFAGVAFAPDGKSLWASGGDEDAVYRYEWRDGVATAAGRVELAKKQPKKSGTRYPAGLAFAPDGRRLYVAENLSDSLAVIDIASVAPLPSAANVEQKRAADDSGATPVIQRLQTDRYPYAVVVSKSGAIFVSSWGDNTVVEFRPSGGALRRVRRIAVARHPSAMLLDDVAQRLYVTSSSTDRISVVDTKSGRVVRTLSDAAPAGPREGMTPNALALSTDRRLLFVAEADANSVAVFNVATGKLLGRVPSEWYPTGLVRAGRELLVICAKGAGTAPNPGMNQPDKPRPPGSPDYALGQLRGSVMRIPERIAAADLAAFTRRVATANGWACPEVRCGADSATLSSTRQSSVPPLRAAGPHPQHRYPPFRHVIYVIKENRSYDQVLGDLTAGDGDSSLVYFPRLVSPNHHALAERFGLFDRFFVNAEVSAQGHNWSTAAYSSEYVEKTTPLEYSDRGRTYDYEGSNGDGIVDEDDDVASPSSGYLWDLAVRKGVSLRNYGEFVWDTNDSDRVPTRRTLIGRTNMKYPGFDLDLTDQHRADVWLEDLRRFTERGEMPALQIIRLPNDHTAGAKAGSRTPRAFMADNDLALGRMVEGLSRSPFWKDTVVFVLEDDAQSGPDHVDSHRSVLLVVSPYSRGGVVHRFVNTTDVLATIEEILGLDSLSQFDYYGRPLRDVFAAEADLRPYEVLRPDVDLDEKNPEGTKASRASMKLDLRRADASDDDAFNRILWSVIKGDGVPFPEKVRAPQGGMGQ